MSSIAGFDDEDGRFITLGKLEECMRWDAVVGVRTHFGSLDAALKAYPQLFTVERDPFRAASVNHSRVCLNR